jgi:hypothetical protein
MILGWNPEIARILGLKIAGRFITGEEERTGLS